MYAALALLTWKLSPSNINMLSEYGGVFCLRFSCTLTYTKRRVWRNRNVFKEEVPEIHQYTKQVAVLNVLYFATFGSERLLLLCCLCSSLKPWINAGSWYGCIGLRLCWTHGFPPRWWLISDKFGRKPTLLILTIGLLCYFGNGSSRQYMASILAVVAAMACSSSYKSWRCGVCNRTLIKRVSDSGQIAGKETAGAYGNGVRWLTYWCFHS